VSRHIGGLHPFTFTALLLRIAPRDATFLAAVIITEMDMGKDSQYDVVIYGATGFTGRLVADYMQQQYGRSVNGAMAGRVLPRLYGHFKEAR
jgi:hypothetical protein